MKQPPDSDLGSSLVARPAEPISHENLEIAILAPSACLGCVEWPGGGKSKIGFQNLRSAGAVRSGCYVLGIHRGKNPDLVLGTGEENVQPTVAGRQIDRPEILRDPRTRLWGSKKGRDENRITLVTLIGPRRSRQREQTFSTRNPTLRHLDHLGRATRWWGVWR
jgi:hypothetical protein